MAMVQGIRFDIVKAADVISSAFWNNGRVDLMAICSDEKLDVLMDDYKNYFDGMLVWDGIEFNIHINTSKGNFPESNRGRFTIAHELGHYFIDNHREGIRTGSIPIHGSRAALVHSDLLELQADSFAANLLMPTIRLRNLTGRRKFSLDIISEVSKTFAVSLTAALLRFVEVGTHDVMVVFSEKGIVKWSVRSDRFPKLVNKFKKGSALPPTSVAGEFIKTGIQYTGIEEVDLEDWFEYRGWEPGWQLYEQCFYSDFYNYVISLVWFK